MWPFAGLWILYCLYCPSSRHSIPLFHKWIEITMYGSCCCAYWDIVIWFSIYSIPRQSIIIYIIDRVTKVTIWFLLTDYIIAIETGDGSHWITLTCTLISIAAKSGCHPKWMRTSCVPLLVECYSWKHWVECGTKTKRQKKQKKTRKKCKNLSFWLKRNVNKWCNAWSSCISISLWSVQVSFWCCYHRCFFNLIKWFKVAWCNWRFLFGWLPLSLILCLLLLRLY